MRTTQPRSCVECNSIFHVTPTKIRQGKGRFCSTACAMKNRSTVSKTQHTHNKTCSTCKTTFYRRKSLSPSKSGHYFCSMKCKALAHSLNSDHTILEMLPSHYGTGNSSYRNFAFKHKKPECESCGYKKIVEVLQVHHKDRNRHNNHIDNLEILCPTCHQEEHFRAKDGLFWNSGSPAQNRTEPSDL